MSEFQVEALRAVGFLGALAVAVPLERLSPHAHLRGDRSVNVSLWLINAVIVGAMCGGCAFTAARWAAGEGIGLLRFVGAEAWIAVPAAVVVLDLVSYAWHRANHRVPLLWRFHQVHHSDVTFTVSTGTRFHPGEVLLSLPVRLAAVVLLGAPVAGVLAFEVAFTSANLVEHGDIGWSRRVESFLGVFLVTPATHRSHHTKVGSARDHNFGTIFPWWDKLFGTYNASDSMERIETGLPGLDRGGVRDALWLPLRRGGLG